MLCSVLQLAVYMRTGNNTDILGIQHAPSSCCSLLQSVAVCCSQLQLVASISISNNTYILGIQHAPSSCCSLLQSIAVCCSLLQLVVSMCIRNNTYILGRSHALSSWQSEIFLCVRFLFVCFVYENVCVCLYARETHGNI